VPFRVFELLAEVRHSIIPNLLEALFDDLRDGVIEHLGIVADADYTTSKGIGGFNKRWQQFHPDGLPPVGLWLMPDHKNDGMLEDLIKQTVCEGEQQSLLQTATVCLNRLPITLFKPHHHTKATLYTWLAWQKRPGQALVSTVNADLIDRQSQEIQSFLKWLRKVFS